MQCKTLEEANLRLEKVNNERQEKALRAIIKAAHEKLAGHSIDLKESDDLESETVDDAVLMLESMWLACDEITRSGHQ